MMGVVQAAPRFSRAVRLFRVQKIDDSAMTTGTFCVPAVRFDPGRVTKAARAGELSTVAKILLDSVAPLTANHRKYQFWDFALRAMC